MARHRRCREEACKKEREEEVTDERRIIDDFHKLYYGPYDAADCSRSKPCLFQGRYINKCPTDLWAYGEIIYSLKPELIIECGSGCGGSAHYMARMMDLAGCSKKAKIYSFDLILMHRTPSKRVRYYVCDSTEPSMVADLHEIAKSVKGNILVVLDSNHAKDHVLKEMNAWHDLVTPGSYMIVEDSNVNGYPVSLDHGEGPQEAIREWLPLHPDFSIDTWPERFLMTFNPNGYLKRTNGKEAPHL